MGTAITALTVAADAIAVATLTLIVRARSRDAQAREAAGALGSQVQEQATQLHAHGQLLSKQSLEITRQQAKISAQADEARRLREHEQQLRAECTRLRQNVHDLRGRLDAAQRSVRHALTERMPAAVAGGAIPAAQADGLDSDVATALSDAVASAAAVGDRLDSMRSAVVALARRVQASAHRIQEEATLMAQRHPADADVLEVSMRADHAAAQQARNAQSMAVLCGQYPGQQWTDPLTLVDVVRAASGRIVAFRRIEVAGDQDVAAQAHVVEPLIHLVAELLANAAQSSPPATQVPVTVRTVQRGAAIEVHDCGVGMDDFRLARAREIASGSHAVGLDGLGEYPQTGLAVVGEYARRHGLRVDLSESVYGGVRAVVLIPADLIETMDPVPVPGTALLPPPEPGPLVPRPRPAFVAATQLRAAAQAAARASAEVQNGSRMATKAEITAVKPAPAAQPAPAGEQAAPPDAASPDAVPAAQQAPAAQQGPAADQPPAGAAPEGSTEQAEAPGPAPAAQPAPADGPAPQALERTQAGLPRRRSPRHQGPPRELAAAPAGASDGLHHAGGKRHAAIAPPASPAEAGAWMSAFLATDSTSAPQDNNSGNSGSRDDTRPDLDAR